MELTFELGLANVDINDAVDVSAINLYLSDDDMMSSTSTSFTAVATYPINVAAGADGSTLTSGLTASISADMAGCPSYSYICAQVTPDEDFECVDISANIDCKGKIKCIIYSWG